MYTRVHSTERASKTGGLISMSKETRNSGFERKSRRKSASGQDSPFKPRRSKGIIAPKVERAPRSPKSRSNRGPENRNRQSGGPAPRQGSGAIWIYGQHAAQAALSNPRRTIHDIYVTANARERLEIDARHPEARTVIPSQIDALFNNPTSHQGIALRVAPLEWPEIESLTADAAEKEAAENTSGAQCVLVLDQITDPHNVGAMLRLASAFGATAVIMQDRNAPPLGGALAKVAVGCLETVPVHLVTNISNTLERLKKDGWFVTGLAGDTKLTLKQALSGAEKMVIVMGAEGPGLRDRVKKTCDQLARIPMMSDAVAGEAESLNVATAAAIALYELRRG
ncbi:MAG: 23S rRNA (guanosine(2251)-2'-O)-methyltransferase RlmB [Maricaulaceae bacterium]